MTKLIIVGSGIFGLSVAEFLTRNSYQGSEIKIISNEHQFAGSNAAAANLATKGQMYARDPHFNLKLQGKKEYNNWIMNLLKEDNNCTPMQNIYKNGNGIDYFTSLENREKHYIRVKQSNIELKKRNLSDNSVNKMEENKIIYHDESWVDAKILLSLLKSVLIKRGVVFNHAEINENNYKELLNKDGISSVIFCTGAWTKNLLNSLKICLSNEIKNKERLTIGSTFFANQIIKDLNSEFVLTEKTSDDLKSKVTFSGNQDKFYISSSSLKIKNLHDFNQDEFEAKNKKILDLAKINMNNAPVLAESNEIISKLDGYRVGYGHSEIVLEEIFIKDLKLRGIICAGAHKSGYLFAPVIGLMVQNLLLEQK